MLTVPAMITLHAIVLMLVCVTPLAAAPAQVVSAQDIVVRNIVLQNMPPQGAPARNVPVRNARVQNLPQDLTREQVLSALGSDDDEIRTGAYIALGVLGERQDLPLLFSALYDNDKLIRKLAEDAIWKVWARSGNPLHDRMYQRGIEQMQSGRLVGAVRSFTALVQLAPNFTEAWNKRATVNFLLGETDQSISDCEEVLAREPNHFGALSGYGQLMLRKGEYRRALGYFERALTSNPNMTNVQSNIDAITHLLEQQADDGI